MIRDAIAAVGCVLVIWGAYDTFAPLAKILAGSLLIWASWNWRPDQT